MRAVKISSGNGGARTVEPSDIESLKAVLRGTLLLLRDGGYDESRTVWNAMIDRRPAPVACCSGVSDVQRAVSLANLSDGAIDITIKYVF